MPSSTDTARPASSLRESSPRPGAHRAAPATPAHFRAVTGATPRRTAVPARRVAGLAMAAVATGGLTAALGQRGLTLVTHTASRWEPAAWTAPGMVRIEDVVGLAAVLVGAVLAAWFFLGLSVAAACAAARAAGRGWVAGERLVARAAPEIVRRALAVSAGTGVALAGAALPAVGVAPPEDLGWSVTSDVGASTPAPLATAPVPATAPAAAPASVPTDSPRLTVASGPAAVLPPAAAVSAPVTTPTQPAAAAADPPSAAVAATDPTATRSTVVVAAGDTLWDIATDHLPAPASDADVAASWPAWYAANAEVIGPDPDLIRPGQRLEAPTGAVADGVVR